MSTKCIALPQPPLVDFTTTNKNDTTIVKIKTTFHKFAPDAKESGTDPKNAPIFGSKAYIESANKKHKTDKHLISNLTYGLPFFRFKQGQKPDIVFENK